MADQHPFPVLTQMHGYNPKLNWHGNDPILSSLSLQELNAKGYINLPMKDIPQDVRYKARKAAAVFKAADYISPTDPEDQAFHPVLRRRNFPTISDQEYEFLKPVLRLASDMLARPEMLAFFKALAGEGYPIDEPKAEKRLGHKLRGFRPEQIAVRDKAEIQRVHQMVGKLGGCVAWSFDGPFENGARDFAAYCIGQNDVPSRCHPEGIGSFIILRPEFMAVMNGNITASQVHPELDDDSALLRARLMLAKFMVHELAHSFNYAYRSVNEKIEPFMADEWIAEVGRALEMWLFNGIMHASGHNPFHVGAPFGLFFHKFPDADTTYNQPVSLKSMARAGIQQQTYYPISMYWVRKLFVPTFWTTEMDRFGIEIMTFPRKIGVRYKTDHQLWDDESPPPSEPRWSPTTGAFGGFVPSRRWSDDFSMYPDLFEGILRDTGVEPLGEDGERVRHALVTRAGDITREMDHPPPLSLGVGVPPPPMVPPYLPASARTPPPIYPPTSTLPDIEPMEGLERILPKSPPRTYKPPPKTPSPKGSKGSSPKDPKDGPPGPPPGAGAIAVHTGKVTRELSRPPPIEAGDIPPPGSRTIVEPTEELVRTSRELASFEPEPEPEPMEDVREGFLETPSPAKKLPVTPKRPSPKRYKESPPRGTWGGPRGPPPDGSAPSPKEFRYTPPRAPRALMVAPEELERIYRRGRGSPPTPSKRPKAPKKTPSPEKPRDSPPKAPKAAAVSRDTMDSDGRVARRSSPPPSRPPKKPSPEKEKESPPKDPRRRPKLDEDDTDMDKEESESREAILDRLKLRLLKSKLEKMKPSPTEEGSGMEGVELDLPETARPETMEGVSEKPLWSPPKGGPPPSAPKKASPAAPKRAEPATTGLKPTARIVTPGGSLATSIYAPTTPAKPGKPTKTPTPPKKDPSAMGYLGKHKVTPPSPSKPGVARAVTPVAHDTPSRAPKTPEAPKKPTVRKAPEVPKASGPAKVPVKVGSFEKRRGGAADSSDSNSSSESSAADSAFGDGSGPPPVTHHHSPPAWMGPSGLGALKLDSSGDEFYKGRSEDEDDEGGDDAPGAGGAIVVAPRTTRPPAVAGPSTAGPSTTGPPKIHRFAIKSMDGARPSTKSPTIRLKFGAGAKEAAEGKGRPKTPSPKGKGKGKAPAAKPSSPILGYPYEAPVRKTPAAPKKPSPAGRMREEEEEEPEEEEEEEDYDPSKDSPLSPSLLASLIKLREESTDTTEESDDDCLSAAYDSDSFEFDDSDGSLESIDDDALLHYLESKKDGWALELKGSREKYGGYEGDDYDSRPIKKGRTSKKDDDEVPRFAPMPSDISGEAVEEDFGYEGDYDDRPAKKGRYSKKDGDEEPKFAPTPEELASKAKEKPPIFEFKAAKEGEVLPPKPRKKKLGSGKIVLVKKKKKKGGKGSKILVGMRKDKKGGEGKKGGEDGEKDEDKDEDKDGKDEDDRDDKDDKEEERKGGKGGRKFEGDYPAFKKARKD